jgi:hypothetical protein
MARILQFCTESAARFTVTRMVFIGPVSIGTLLANDSDTPVHDSLHAAGTKYTVQIVGKFLS